MPKKITFQAHPLIRGTFLLTAAGLLSRVMGFFYRIFLSRMIGAEGMGIYQLIFPVYAILHSFCAAGIQTSISRLVAARDARSAAAASSRRSAQSPLVCGLILSLGLSVGSALLLYIYAGPAAVFFLQERRCEPLLRALALAVPLGSIHACINGYYYGFSRAAVPSAAQFIEQSARMLFVWMAYRINLQEGKALSLEAAVLAIAAGELFSSLYSVTVYLLRERPGSVRHASGKTFDSSDKSSGSFSQYERLHLCFGTLLALAVPLTANRLLINLLSSAESILIPARLQIHGHSAADALSLYGVLTGMSMPLVLFPTAITNSVSVLLLPAVARAQSGNNEQQISSTIHATVKYCLLLGILFLGIFLLYGDELGVVIFNSALAGDFLRTLAWICPFLYLSSTLASILNGLGKTTTVFLQNIFCLLLRILFLFFLVPVFGIRAYLWSLLLSLLLQTFLSCAVLHPHMRFSFPAADWILKPCLFLLIAVGCAFFMEPVFALLFPGIALLALGARLASVCGVYTLLLFLFLSTSPKK